MSTILRYENLEPEALLQMCSSLVQSITALKDSVPTATLELQTRLASLSELLRSILRDKDHPELAAVLRSTDELKNTARLETLRKAIDKISEEVLVGANDIFTSLPGHPERETFTVREREVFSENKSPNAQADVIICPHATFLHGAGIRTQSKILKFGCRCEQPGVSHDGQLEYRVGTRQPFLVEKLRLNRDRSWEIVLYKPSSKSVVSITISGVSPAGVRRIQALSKIFAMRYLRANKTLLGGPGLGYALVSSDSLLLMDCVLDPEPPLPMILRIQFQTSDGPVSLGWEPKYLGLFHYKEAPKRELDLLEESHQANFPLQSHARLLIARRGLSEEHTNSDEIITVAVYKDTTIVQKNHRLGPLWVMLSGVEVTQHRVQIGRGQVDFQLGSQEDAANFAALIEAMRQRLLQTFAQGAFSDEIDLYVQDSEALTLGSGEGPRTDISVVLTKNERLRTQKLRMIVTRKGSTGILCLDFGTKTLQVAQQCLQKSQDLVGFWFFDYNASGIPTVVPSNWDKLRMWGRKPVKTRHENNFGGTQVVSDRSITSEDWLDSIDDLKTAMDAAPSVKGFHKPVKVCVIDTGFHAKDPESKKVKVFKDFVDPNNKQLLDLTWHGTLSATIILSICEQCELYVARVFKTNDTDDETEPALVAEAIDWAIGPDQDVDIINISAGFLHHSPRLQEAVQKASGANKLIFAAASNWGNSGPVAFPARHDLYTICIFSTNVHYQGSWFNPERRPYSHNFAFLGEDWQHRGQVNKREQGTSMATAAASGLAALILDFSRHADNQTIVRVGDVGKLLGMIAIFNSMARRAGEYKCVEPKALLPSRYEHMSPGGRRSYIRASISRAMDQAN